MNKLLFIYRFLNRLALFLLVSVPLQLAGMIILFPFTYIYQIGALPIWLRWFDSADPYVGRNTETIELETKKGWMNRYYWLALRNPINYFSYKYLGFIWNSPEILNVQGPMNVGDATDHVAGYKYIEIKQNNKIYYEYVYIYVYKLTANSLQKCIRFRMGWKISDPYKNKNGELQQEVFVISPYHSYNGL